MTQDDSLPLCFESFQVLKEMWYKILKEMEEQLVEIYEFEPIYNKLQQSFQVLYDQRLRIQNSTSSRGQPPLHYINEQFLDDTNDKTSFLYIGV